MDNEMKVSSEGKIIIVKENDIIKSEQATDEALKDIRKTTTLCFDCANFDKCKKVEDREKLTIDKYDFISDGAQVIDENDDIESFIVNNCRDFVRDEERKYTGAKAIEMRRDLKKDYFDTETIEEANSIADKIEYEKYNSAKRR